MVFKGLARDWPLVRAGLESAEAAMDYLSSHDRGGRLLAYVGEPEIKGRFFYDDSRTA
jgi:hypothetical protein